MSLEIIHVAEDDLSAGATQRLVGRIIEERGLPWLREQWSEAEYRPGILKYVSLEREEGWTKSTRLKELRRKLRHLNVKSSGNAALAYVSIRLVGAMPPEDPGEKRLLLLSFDTDHGAERERCSVGIKEADLKGESTCPTLVAEASPEFDAWVIAGFEPASVHEAKLLGSVRESLEKAGHSIDPVAQPHLLTGDIAGDPRDAKLLCQRLLGLKGQAEISEPRVVECLGAPLETLEKNGQAAGLAEFFKEVQDRVLPLLEAPTP